MTIPIEDGVFDDLMMTIKMEIMIIPSYNDNNRNQYINDNSRLHFPVYVSYCAAQPAMDQRLKQLRFCWKIDDDDD